MFGVLLDQIVLIVLVLLVMSFKSVANLNCREYLRQATFKPRISLANMTKGDCF